MDTKSNLPPVKIAVFIVSSIMTVSHLAKGCKTRLVKELLIQPEDVTVDIRQKGIDMKIGVDIASLAFSNTAAIQAVSNLAKSANGARVGFELTK